MSISPSADVISLSKRAAWRPDFKSMASQRLREAREQAGLDRAAFAAFLTGLLGWGVAETALARWERGSTPPGDVLLAAAGGDLIAAPDTMLTAVPHSFPADALAGRWVTCYRFLHHGETLRHHADIAHVTATSERRIRAVNHPPEPRSEGRARPFRNEIEVQLAGRHLVGTWKNSSDTRYFGTVQLAVLPGEMVMEGHFTGVGSDVEVSGGRWKWVRLEAGAGPLDVTLRDPAAIYDLVTNHPQYDDAPLTLADVREER